MMSESKYLNTCYTRFVHLMYCVKLDSRVMPCISITNLCNAIPNALLHLPAVLTDLQKLFCFFASHSNLCQYDILLLPTKLITQADPRVFSINNMCINVEYRSKYNSCFNASTELFLFTECNYMYIRREFTDIILKNIKSDA
jgi:hypothetical protein